MSIFDRPDPVYTDTIRKDRLDRLDWQSARTIGHLPAAAEELGKVASAAPDVLGDLYAAFVKAHPELTPTNQVAPSHLVNRAVMAEVLGSDAYADLRQYSVRDKVASALACMTYQRHLSPLFEQVGERVAEQVAEAEAAQRDLDDLLDRLDPEGDTPPGEAPSDDEVDAARQRADAARAAVSDELDELGPMVGRAARRAGAEAAAEAAEEAEMMSTWGTGPGERGRMDTSARLALAGRLNSARLRKITALMGAMTNLSWGVRQTRYTNIPEEVFDVTLSGDPGRLLSSEYAALAVPEMEDMFFLRLVQEQLLSYDFRGVEREGKGAIIYVEDGSGSMSHGGGDKELWAKAFGLALLGIAKAERRPFHVIHFGGAGQAEVFSFAEPAAFTTEAMLDYAETFLDSGGTDFVTPLTRAVELLEDEHAATGRTSADIVFATDGDDGGVVHAWLPTYHEAKARLGFSAFGVAIGCDPSHPSLTGVCDRVASVRALTTGDDVREVFRAVTS